MILGKNLHYLHRGSLFEEDTIAESVKWWLAGDFWKTRGNAQGNLTGVDAEIRKGSGITSQVQRWKKDRGENASQVLRFWPNQKTRNLRRRDSVREWKPLTDGAFQNRRRFPRIRQNKNVRSQSSKDASVHGGELLYPRCAAPYSHAARMAVGHWQQHHDFPSGPIFPEHHQSLWWTSLQ